MSITLSPIAVAIRIANILIVSLILMPDSAWSQKRRDIAMALPFPSASVTLSPSWIQQRENLNLSYLKSLDPDRLLHNFRVNAGIASSAMPLEGWEAPGIGLRGHFTGHYLSAVSHVIEKNNDLFLKSRLNYMVDALATCQTALGHGYLSAFPEREFDLLETKVDGIWAPYYTYHKIMQGLLDAHLAIGNKKALDAVIKMAEYVNNRMSKLTEQTIEKIFYTAQANPVNEAGGMNEVLYRLYKVTRDPNHLKLAKVFDREWFYAPLAQNKDILSGLHSNTHLVLVNGFTERYSITNESTFHDAAINFWDILIQHHAYANGSSSGPRPNVTTPTSLTAEHWGVPDHLSNTMTREIAESCVSYNTQKLTSTLFTWTQDPRYADAYMNTYYNAVLPAQNPSNGAVVYHLPLSSPRNKAFLKETDYRCCNASALEAFSSLEHGIYYHRNDDLWVNLYVPSIAHWTEKNITLEQKGTLPKDSTVEFVVSTKGTANFALNLFIPSWATAAEIYVNGEKEEKNATPLSFYRINRNWKNNDRISLLFHYKFHLKAMPDDQNMVAIFYGPTMLAFETTDELILKSTPSGILKNLSKKGNGIFQLSLNGTIYTLKPFFDIESQGYAVYATIRDY